jgi:hypothetical protein
VARCAQLGAYYDAEDLKRFAPAKRYALVARKLTQPRYQLTAIGAPAPNLHIS